jgi:flagellar biosynthesis chaperone FliJ
VRIFLKSMIFVVIGILVMTQIPHSSAQTVLHLSTVVHMQEKDLTVTVYYYSGEEEWAQIIFDTTVEALPILERLAGFSYPHSFDVEIYPKTDVEMEMFGGKNLMERGIWINRDAYTLYLIKSAHGRGMVIHENAHYWSNNSIYGKPWLKEGFCELFTYLTFKEMGREEDALSKKNEWSRIFSTYTYYDIPLDEFEYQGSGPSSDTTELAYSKSALFCLEIYEKYGLDEIQQINEYLHRNSIAADSFSYVNLLEECTGEDQKEFFMEWVFPDIDVEEWQHAQDALNELEELIDDWLFLIDETYGFENSHRLAWAAATKIDIIKSCMSGYNFERAAQAAEKEIEEINKIMPEFERYALQYSEVEEYYNSLEPVLGEILEDKFLAIRESLFSLEFDLFVTQLEEFYEEMKTLRTYETMYNSWCGEGCASLYPLRELLSQKPYEEVIATVDHIVTAFHEYTVIEKELANKDLFTTVGIALLRKSGNFESDLEYAHNEIRNGDAENAYNVLASLRKELSRTRKVGAGTILIVLAACTSFLVGWRKKF